MMNEIRKDQNTHKKIPELSDYYTIAQQHEFPRESKGKQETPKLENNMRKQLAWHEGRKQLRDVRWC